MNSSNHPDAEQLSAYLAEPTANRFSQLRMHLLDCHDCRSELDFLSALKEHLPGLNTETYQQSLGSSDDFSRMVDRQEIEQFVDGKLDDESGGYMQNILRENGQALKMALHYASHSACMKRELGENRKAESITEQHLANSTTTWSQTKRKFHQWLTTRLPFWLTIPIGASMAGLLIIALLPQSTQIARTETVVAYQDNPVIQFRKSKELPGIGFFSNANKFTKPYDNINVVVKNKSVVEISWPAVAKAVAYTLNLKQFKKGQQVLVDKVTTAENHASLRRLDNDAGQRYIWHLQGKTTDGNLFSAKGGFVIQND